MAGVDEGLPRELGESPEQWMLVLGSMQGKSTLAFFGIQGLGI